MTNVPGQFTQTKIAGEEILIHGTPDLDLLKKEIAGPGDLWHSGLLRDCDNLFPELVYATQVYWFYLNDADNSVRSVSWRVDSTAFAVRLSAWEALGGFDAAYSSEVARAIDLGFRLLRLGGVPLHVPSLFPSLNEKRIGKASLQPGDKYLFFARHFKREYRLYAYVREALKRRAPIKELAALRQAEKLARTVPAPTAHAVPSRPLCPLSKPGPKVSAIVPTLRRQSYTANLLSDYVQQTVPLHEIIVVDATPEEERDYKTYEQFSRRLPLQVIWQKSLGSCRARNEAIRRSTGEYILFADDDTRVPPEFVENHVRLLETYDAEASNGLDIRADHPEQSIEDLRKKVSGHVTRNRVGAADNFNNANTLVRRRWVQRCIGNDINFDGGYGEDRDFGHCLIDKGGVILFNPYSANLHLKPPVGGYRWWGEQAAKGRRERKRQPWEYKRQVGMISPKPSPTIMYGFLKHYTADQVREWLYSYLLRSWWPTFTKPHESPARRMIMFGPRLLMTPLRLYRVWLSYQFARDLLRIGPRFD